MVISFVVSLFVLVITLYMWSFTTNIHIKFNSIKTWILSLLCSFLLLINRFSINVLFQLVNLFVILIILYKFLFKKEFRQSIVYPLITTIFYFAIYLLLWYGCVSISCGVIENDYNNQLIFLVGVIISLFLFKVPFISNGVRKLNNYISNVNKQIINCFSIFLIIMYLLFLFNLYYILDKKVLIIAFLVLVFILFLFIIIFIKMRNDYYDIYDEYNNSLLSLKEFENVLSNYRIDNHENRNHLLTIRNMTKNKKITDFIDTILDNKVTDSLDIMHQVSVIPNGGLRGLIYSKMLIMEKKGIDCELDVEKIIKTIDFVDYGDHMLLDICKILGIFLDNAIEEVEKLNDRYIVIEMFMKEDAINILVTNVFDNTVDKTDIYKSGYSTKGAGRGYGLALVKKIVSQNGNLKAHHMISDNEFTQVLEIYK